jgi:hypothetical protein
MPYGSEKVRIEKLAQRKWNILIDRHPYRRTSINVIVINAVH